MFPLGNVRHGERLFQKILGREKATTAPTLKPAASEVTAVMITTACNSSNESNSSDYSIGSSNNSKHRNDKMSTKIPAL